jgi:L,D-transpeptidase ErfK/SrfK
MGMLAMQTGFPEIYIHGTNEPWGVGMRTSHGCFHLYPEDAAELFPILPVGAPVRIINDPYVVGRRYGRLYMAAFEQLTDYPSMTDPLSTAVAAVVRLLSDKPDAGRRAEVDWERVISVAQAGSPVPMAIIPGAQTLENLIAEIEPEVHRYSPYGKDANSGLLPNH